LKSLPVTSWRVLFGLALTSVLLASLAPTGGSGLVAGVDKLAHAVTYAVLYWLAWLAFPGPVLRWSIHLGLLAFGALIEILQARTGYRMMEVADLLANVTGAVLANLVLASAARKTTTVTGEHEEGA